MRKTVALLASMAAAVMLASMVALPTPQNTARAAFPGTNAKIVFARDPDGSGGPKDSEIFTIWFNGNNPTPLTNNTKTDTAPSWSADGKKIVFERGSNLYTMSANGSNKKKVPNSTFGSYNFGGRLVSYGGNPAFSPSGRKIVFDSGSNIYTINVDGTDRNRITRAQAGDPYEDKPDFANPVWSPVSNKISFSYNFGAPKVHAMPLSDLMNRQYLGLGSQVTPGWTYRPDWSPDGAQIAFECYYADCYDNAAPHSVNPEIYKANANGTGDAVRLTNDPATDTYPAFSPGGGKVVFSSNRDGDFDLYITNADGTGDPLPLTSNSARDVLPDWQAVQSGNAASVATGLGQDEVLEAALPLPLYSA